jgi:hypothetical protein
MSDNKESFEWDNNGDNTDVNFFGETVEETADVIEEINKTDVAEKEEEKATDKEEEGKETEEEEEEEETTFFSEDPEEEEEEGEEENEEEEGTDEKGEKQKKTRASKLKSTSVLQSLKEKGLVDYELEEGQELTDELADEILEDSFDNKLDQRIAELVEDMPEDAANFFKFIKEGGNTQQYLYKLAQQAVSSRIVEGMDLENEANQELIVREQLAAEGDDQETINAQIEFLKESNKLASVSKSKYKKWETKNKAEKQALVEKQKQAALAAKENQRKLKTQVSTFLKDKDSVGKLKFTKSEKKELPSYMTDKNVQLENGSSITTMQKDLYEAMRDETKAVMLAKLLKSDFNFDMIEEEVEDKIAKKTKEQLRRTDKKPSKSGKSSSPSKRGSLADFF